MPTRRFERIGLAQLLVGCAVVFGACILVEQVQAQYVPPPTPLPPPVFNPSSPNTVPQPSYKPITPTTPSTTPSIPSTVPSDEVRSPANEEPPSTAARSERQASVAKKRSVHHHRGHFAEPTLGSYICGSSPCVRIHPWAFYYTASALWWPGYYDYAPGQFGRAGYLGRGYRPAGYHGD